MGLSPWCRTASDRPPGIKLGDSVERRHVVQVTGFGFGHPDLGWTRTIAYTGPVAWAPVCPQASVCGVFRAQANHPVGRSRLDRPELS